MRQPYTGWWILSVENIANPMKNMNIKFIHDITVKFLINRQKHYPQPVHSAQWNSWIVIWHVASNSVNSDHILLKKKRTIHGCDAFM